MLKRYFLVSSLALATANSAIASYDSDDELNNNNNTFSPFRNSIQAEEQPTPPQTEESDDINKSIDLLGSQIRSFGRSVFQWQEAGDDELNKLDALIDAFGIDPSTTSIETVRKQYPNVESSIERKKSEYEANFRCLNVGHYIETLRQSGMHQEAIKLGEVEEEVKRCINKVASFFHRQLKNKIALVAYIQKKQQEPPLSEEEKRARALEAEARRKLMEPLLKKYQEASAKFFGGKDPLADIDGPQGMTRSEAIEFFRNFERETNNLKSRLQTAMDDVLQTLEHSEIDKDDLTGVNVDTVKRIFHELEQRLTILRKVGQDNDDFLQRAAEAFITLGNHNKAEEVKSHNLVSKDVLEKFIQRGQSLLDKCKQQLDEALRKSANQTDDESDDDGPDFQSYFANYQRCAQGEKPGTDQTFVEFVAYGCYLLRNSTKEDLVEQFGESAFEELNQCSIKHANHILGCLFQMFARVDGAQMIATFQNNTIPMVHAFAKCFKLELMNDDPAHLKKMMGVVIKRLEGMNK